MVSEVDLGSEEEIEMYTAYYDIFVRNAFGNFRDVLREVIYSVLYLLLCTAHALGRVQVVRPHGVSGP